MSCTTIVNSSICVEANVKVSADVEVGEVCTHCIGKPYYRRCRRGNQCVYIAYQRLGVQFPLIFTPKVVATPAGVVCENVSAEHAECHSSNNINKEPCDCKSNRYDHTINHCDTMSNAYGNEIDPYGNRENCYDNEMNSYGNEKNCYDSEMNPYGNAENCYHSERNPYMDSNDSYTNSNDFIFVNENVQSSCDKPIKTCENNRHEGRQQKVVCRNRRNNCRQRNCPFSMIAALFGVSRLAKSPNFSTNERKNLIR